MPEATASEKESLSNWVQMGSKLGAIGLLVVYGVGYLVTSINLAANGMVLSSPIKPRVAAAGVLFAFLVGLPIFAWTSTAKNLNMPLPNWPEQSNFPPLYRFWRFFQVSILLALPLAQMFEFTSASSRWRVWCIFGVSILELAIMAAVHEGSRWATVLRTHHQWVALIYLALVIFIIVLGVTALPGGFSRLIVPYWMFGCGVWYEGAKLPTSRGLGGKFASGSVQCFVPVIIFATFLYPHTKSEWGGGQPVDIIVRFAKDSPLFPAQKLKLRLLDESDAGLYVLQENKRRALYIPRADVAAIAFSADLGDMP